MPRPGHRSSCRRRSSRPTCRRRGPLRRSWPKPRARPVSPVEAVSRSHMSDAFSARLTKAVEAAAATHENFLARSASTATEAAQVIRDAIRDGRMVLIFGNGGSATDAQHFAAEQAVKYARVRCGAAGVALAADGGVVTPA